VQLPGGRVPPTETQKASGYLSAVVELTLMRIGRGNPAPTVFVL
jgi:hypothetical protein